MQKNKAKESEDARFSYENCLQRIQNFDKLKKFYLALKDKNSVQAACIRSAILQETCLIGDTLTWLRSGPFGYDFKDFPPNLKALAKEFSSNAIRAIIEKRNFYSHQFLYFPENEKIRKFEELLMDDVEFNLNKIKSTMEKQLKDLRLTGEFVGEIGKGENELDFAKIMSTSQRELQYIKYFEENRESLERDFGIVFVKKALDWHIRNVCQSFKDYQDLIAKGSEEARSVLEKQNALLAREPEIMESFAFLMQADSLRNYLAHPNMKSLESVVEKTREEFLRKRDGLLEVFSEIEKIVNDVKRAREEKLQRKKIDASERERKEEAKRKKEGQERMAMLDKYWGMGLDVGSDDSEPEEAGPVVASSTPKKAKLEEDSAPESSFMAHAANRLSAAEKSLAPPPTIPAATDLEEATAKDQPLLPSLMVGKGQKLFERTPSSERSGESSELGEKAQKPHKKLPGLGLYESDSD